jgi:hypothetical protein
MMKARSSSNFLLPKPSSTLLAGRGQNIDDGGRPASGHAKDVCDCAAPEKL